MRIRQFAVVAILLAVIVSACTEPTSPEATKPGDKPPPTQDTVTVVGRYSLNSAAGSALPALINRSIDTVTHDVIDTYVLSDTLEVTSDGRYVQRARLEERIGDIMVGRSQWVDRGRLSRMTDVLQFASDYIQNVAFAGRLESTGGIRVSQDLANEGKLVEYAFSRVP